MSSTQVQFLLSSLILWNVCESARIIAVMPIPSFSHQVLFQPLWKELLSRGHDVTLLTTEPINDANFSNLRQIHWSFANEMFHVKHNYSNIIQNFRVNKLRAFNQYIDMMNDIVIQELEYHEVQELIKDEKEYFDVAIVEFLHPTMLAFSEKFNCPLIGVSSMDILSFAHDMIGNPTNPAIYTDFLSPYDSQMNFYERFLNTFAYITTTLYFNYYFYPKEDITAQKYFGSNLPKLKDIQKNVSMVFLNMDPVLNSVRPLMPNVLQLGGAMQVHKLNPLPQDLETFLNGSHNGVIYFSLGSNVKISSLPEGSFDVLLETFQSLPLGVVWKIDEKSHMWNGTSNIYTGQWFPQQEILAHKNVKLFITQGGQQSLEEAIYYGVRLIGLPFYVDQFANIRRLSRKGACKALDPQNLSKEHLTSVIQEVLTNETYLNSIKELSTLLKDRPTSSLDQAVWWIEYVIRHKGADILKSKVSDMPLYQYFLLDVIGVVILFIIFLLIIQYMLIRLVIKFIRYKIRDKSHYKFD